VLTALIGIAALAVLFRWKVSNPLLFVGAAYFGLLPPAASARLSDE
jgi:chromate transporter